MRKLMLIATMCVALTAAMQVVMAQEVLKTQIADSAEEPFPIPTPDPPVF